jgi:hypothetical protein
MLGEMPADAMLLQNQTKNEYYDTFKVGRRVFGMPLSDNPTFAACCKNDKVLLVTVRDVKTNDDVTLPTTKAREQLQRGSGLHTLLKTTPTPVHVALDGCAIPPLTQVVTTSSTAIRRECNLEKISSLRCVVGTVPITQADVGAVPAHVQVLQYA